MMELTELQPGQSDGACCDELVLPYDTRKRSRFRAATLAGKEVGIFLPRGSMLRCGDRLLSSDGEVVKVVAAKEKLSQANCDDPHLLCRAAYHLGNRHVPIQIETDCVRYQHDHVLDEMVIGLGLEVKTVELPFQPEDGAYASGGHHHHHEH